MIKNKLQDGQTLLIVVLVMVIAATVGLSVVSRSITNLRTSTEEASSAKALSAAEAGIQQQLQSSTSLGNDIAVPGIPNTKYSTNVAAASVPQVLLNGGNTVAQDEGVDLWLVPHNASNNPDWSSGWSGKLEINWGDSSGDCNNALYIPAALEIVIISNPLSYTLTRYAFDPCASRVLSNRFTLASTRGDTFGGKTFVYKVPITVSSGLIARVVPLYANTYVGVTGQDSAFPPNPQALPSQGQMITSTGTSGPSGNAVVRKINVFQGYPQLPVAYFTYGFFFPKNP